MTLYRRDSRLPFAKAPGRFVARPKNGCYSRREHKGFVASGSYCLSREVASFAQNLFKTKVKGVEQ